MKSLLFILLAGYAVRCDDTNYYVIQIAEDDPPVREFKKPFKVYWNVPTMQCKSKKIPFGNLYEKYGIIQNKNDSFRGEKISILYDPGLFPALLKNESSGKFKFRNGGVPQEGDLDKHLESFRAVLDQSIPDKYFSGVGIIDFESWRPVFRQNFGVLIPYKDVSYELEKNIHWWWPKTWIQAEAKQRFEKSARQFMQTTISVAKQMRPNALWGYYGFPYCFNMASNNMKESCADKVPEENDRTSWLWSESSALYPSVYSSQSLSTQQLSALVRGRAREAARVARRGGGALILPYVWFRYRDGGYLTEKDLEAVLQTLYESEASGFIIWGSSDDVNTASKCNKLQHYINNVLGPAVAKYLKPGIILQDEMEPIDSNNTRLDGNMTTTIKSTLDDYTINIYTNNVTTTTTIKPPWNDNIETNNSNMTVIKPILDGYDVNNDTKLEPDPDYHWNPPENYTQDIKQNVEEEILKKTGYNVSVGENFDNETMTDKENLLLKFLLHLLSSDQTEKYRGSEKKLPVSTDTAITTYNVEIDSSTTQKNNIITNSNIEINNDANINTDARFKMSTDSTNEYYSTVTDKIYTESTLIDIFYDTFDNYDTITESSTVYTDVAATESAINSRSTTSENNREITDYRDVSTEANTVTEYAESIDYSDENFLEVDDEDNRSLSNDDNEELLNETALSLPSTASADQVSVSTSIINGSKHNILYILYTYLFLFVFK